MDEETASAIAIAIAAEWNARDRVRERREGGTLW